MLPLFLFLITLFFCSFLLFFFNDTATTEIYTLSLHDALPISAARKALAARGQAAGRQRLGVLSRSLVRLVPAVPGRSEEHTSELQSRRDLVCRLLLEKKKKKKKRIKKEKEKDESIHNKNKKHL